MGEGGREERRHWAGPISCLHYVQRLGWGSENNREKREETQKSGHVHSDKNKLFKRVKRQDTTWEKNISPKMYYAYFDKLQDIKQLFMAKHISDKKVVIRIHKELSKHNKKMTQLKNGQKMWMLK